MEHLVEQPEKEKLRSFDPLASVDMLRFDLERFGQILPETRQRVCDEELSFLAEGVDRQARLPFVLRREDAELKYFDKGKWRPYRSMLWTGLRVAEQEAAEDSRLNFLAERAFSDIQHAARMEELKPGERHAWHASYPKREEKLYGKKFLQERGFQTEREMGFLYMATGLADGSVLLESQTVDRSDDKSFEAALDAARNPGADLDDMTRAYDRKLAEKHGGNFHAGRRDIEIQENIWQTIQNQRDLISYFLDGLENIAQQNLPHTLLEEITKKHTYGVWAAFKKRIDAHHIYIPETKLGVANPYAYHQVAREVNVAFLEFARQGRPLIGCGGIIKMLLGERDILEASAEDVFSSIFGRGQEDKYGSLEFKCPKGHSNTRPRNKLLDECKVCRVSVKC